MRRGGGDAVFGGVFGGAAGFDALADAAAASSGATGTTTGSGASIEMAGAGGGVAGTTPAGGGGGADGPRRRSVTPAKTKRPAASASMVATTALPFRARRSPLLVVEAGISGSGGGGRVVLGRAATSATSNLARFACAWAMIWTTRSTSRPSRTSGRSSVASSAADPTRRSGSLTRQAETARWRASGACGKSSPSGVGGSRRMRVNSSGVELAKKGWSPETSS